MPITLSKIKYGTRSSGPVMKSFSHGEWPVPYSMSNITDQSTRMILPSTGKAISGMISGQEEIDQQNPMDADTSLLASGYNPGAL
jgi:hypothetical protein